LLDHVGKVALVHADHSAVGMAAGEVTAQQLILLFGRPRLAGGDFEVGMTAQHPALGGARLELAGHDPDRDAGGAIEAGGAVGDRLAATKADPSERLVQVAGMVSAQLGEHLPLRLARQIGAWRRAGDEESREAKRCAQRNSAGL
jgi:hypothetical protein